MVGKMDGTILLTTAPSLRAGRVSSRKKDIPPRQRAERPLKRAEIALRIAEVRFWENLGLGVPLT